MARDLGARDTGSAIRVGFEPSWRGGTEPVERPGRSSGAQHRSIHRGMGPQGTGFSTRSWHRARHAQTKLRPGRTARSCGRMVHERPAPWRRESGRGRHRRARRESAEHYLTHAQRLCATAGPIWPSQLVIGSELMHSQCWGRHRLNKDDGSIPYFAGGRTMWHSFLPEKANPANPCAPLWDNANRLARVVYRAHPYARIALRALRRRVRASDLARTQFPFLFPDAKKPPILTTYRWRGTDVAS
jgi:hypothetical protein